MKKVIIVISILLVVCGIGIWIYLSKTKSTPPAWKIARIDTGTISVNVTATGSLSAVTTVLVGAQVSGIISKIFVDFNSVVKKGQVIALLDTTLLRASAKNASAVVEKASAQVELTQSQFARENILYGEKMTAKADYDLAYSTYHAAQADLKAALAALDHEKTMLRYATIKAPSNGTVISRNVDVGQTVISSFNAPTLFTIANDLKFMQVLANVDEADIGQVHVGQQTVFTVDAYPYDVFKGQVAQVRLQPVMVQNVNNYIVVINVENKDLNLLPGLTANITIKVIEHPNVLKVPVNAIHFIPPVAYLESIDLQDSLKERIENMKIPRNELPKPGDVCYIWIKKGTEIKPVQVKTGLFDGTYIELLGNINKGDEVVVGEAGTQAAPSTNNPFMPKMPSRRGLR